MPNGAKRSGTHGRVKWHSRHSRWSYGIADVDPYGIERCIYHECIVATEYESWEAVAPPCTEGASYCGTASCRDPRVPVATA